MYSPRSLEKRAVILSSAQSSLGEGTVYTLFTLFTSQSFAVTSHELLLLLLLSPRLKIDLMCFFRFLCPSAFSRKPDRVTNEIKQKLTRCFQCLITSLTYQVILFQHLPPLVEEAGWKNHIKTMSLP